MEDADIQQHDAGDDDMAHASIPTSLHQHDAGDDSVNQSPPSSRKKTPKVKFAPPSNELIFGHHENDVLLGRGASTNIHPGNVAFRATCALRKQDFDAASNAHKRDIAIETVQSVLALDPPGRFLERVDGEIIINQDGTASFDGNGWEDNDVDVHSLMSPNNVKYMNELGWAQNKHSKHWKRALGPWRDVGMEKSIQKACAVIRDHKRQDRVALKAMGMLKKGSNKMTGMGVSYYYLFVSVVFRRGILSNPLGREVGGKSISLYLDRVNCSRIKHDFCDRFVVLLSFDFSMLIIVFYVLPFSFPFILLYSYPLLLSGAP